MTETEIAQEQIFQQAFNAWEQPARAFIELLKAFRYVSDEKLGAQKPKTAEKNRAARDTFFAEVKRYQALLEGLWKAASAASNPGMFLYEDTTEERRSLRINGEIRELMEKKYYVHPPHAKERDRMWGCRRLEDDFERLIRAWQNLNGTLGMLLDHVLYPDSDEEEGDRHPQEIRISKATAQELLDGWDQITKAKARVLETDEKEELAFFAVPQRANRLAEQDFETRKYVPMIKEALEKAAAKYQLEAAQVSRFLNCL
jgi:hypothetical protein